MLYGTNTLSIAGERGVQGVKKRSDKRWKGRCEGEWGKGTQRLIDLCPIAYVKG